MNLILQYAGRACLIGFGIFAAWPPVFWLVWIRVIDSIMVQMYKDIGLNYLLKQVRVLLNSTTDLEVPQIDKFAVKTTWLGLGKNLVFTYCTAELLTGNLAPPTIFSQPFDDLTIAHSHM